MEELEKDKEKLSQKIYKLEKQLVSQNQHLANQNLGCSVDTVRIEIKHKVMLELVLLRYCWNFVFFSSINHPVNFYVALEAVNVCSF